MEESKLVKVLSVVSVIVLVLLLLGCVGLTIYCLITFGNKPASEVPFWAWWFMFGGGSN